jgi:hypothetical protein
MSQRSAKIIRRFKKFFGYEINSFFLMLVYLLLIFVILASLFNLWNLFKIQAECTATLQAVGLAPAATVKSGGVLPSSGDKAPGIVYHPDEASQATAIIANPGETWWSFGDNFSSDAYLNLAATNLSLDTKVTALTFTPLFSVDKVADCQTSACNLPPAGTINFSSTTPACLNNNCLSGNGAQLQFNGQDIAAPIELAGQTIQAVEVSKLTTLWVVSYIVADGSNEVVYSYLFNGQKFLALASVPGSKILETKYGRGGGAVAAGGTDDDFLLVYMGYEPYIFHVKNEQVKDLSALLSLRVADNGFIPYVIKTGQGNSSTWYITSLTVGKLKLIKLWQNGTDEIIGARDFSPDVNSHLTGQAVALVLAAGQNAIQWVVEQAGAYSLWQFSDQGFDNSHNYQAESTQLNNSGKTVLAAVMKNVQVAGDNIKFYVADKANHFEAVDPEISHAFNQPGSELFWQATFAKGADNSYSPWLGAINYLNYLVK